MTYNLRLTYNLFAFRFEEEKLYLKFRQLSFATEEALIKQEELKRAIASQGDDQWIELVLMQKLGLVPENHTKVHFRVCSRND